MSTQLATTVQSHLPSADLELDPSTTGAVLVLSNQLCKKDPRLPRSLQPGVGWGSKLDSRIWKTQPAGTRGWPTGGVKNVLKTFTQQSSALRERHASSNLPIVEQTRRWARCNSRENSELSRAHRKPQCSGVQASCRTRGGSGGSRRGVLNEE